MMPLFKKRNKKSSDIINIIKLTFYENLSKKR